MLLMAKPPKSAKQQITIRVNAHFLKLIEQIGERVGRNRSEMIDRAVEEFVLRHDEQPQPDPARLSKPRAK